jgi:polyadenylate-binding protein
MAAPVTPANAGTASYSMSSLYVGDLHPDVNEATLFEKFSAAGPVLSIRVCRDNASRLSLGYAYVNFQQPADAERALDTMNFDSLHGKPMRIMWSQRDPAARRSGAGNIFIKNLDKVIDNKSIYDTFSLFGNILSCKVATDEEGNSKGYGFVHFETEEAAQNAIQKVNGMLLAGKKVFVGKFQPRAQRLRDMGETTKRFTNVFVKNFGEQMDKDELEKMFAKYGEITSCAVMCDGEGKSKGFGFVAFKNAEEAEKAVNEMHEQAVEGSENKLTVCRAQKKGERQAELKRKYEAQKAERMQRYQGVNLYVKNLDDTFDDETLRKQFENFGKITSAKVMTDENGRSKGFGFVCFENAEEATKAVTDMNSKMVCSKPLYVAIAQRKEDRRAQLASQYMQRLASMRMHNSGMPGGTMYQPSAGGYFVNPVQSQGRFMGGGVAGAGGMRMAQGRGWGMQGQQYGQPFMMQGSGPMFQRNNTRPGGATPNAGGRPPQQFNQQGGGVPQAARIGQGPRVAQPGAVAGQPQAGAPRPQTGPRTGVPTGAKPGAPVMYQQQQQYPQQNQPRQPQSGIIVGGQEPLTSHMLASAAPQEQKQLLGERIYALLNTLYPTMKEAGKITGMMLEIDNSELVMMLQDNDLFRSKVEEASAVLSQSNAKST